MDDLDFIGPFERHEVVLNGRLVPHLNATPVEGGIHLNLDDRLGLDLSHDEALRFIPFLADTIAVTMGYTCFPCDEVPEPPRRTPWGRMTSLADHPPLED
jgi:hypothetical protein